MTTRNFSKKDEINSRNSLALQSLSDGELILIKKAAVLQRPDKETGEVKDVAVLITDSGDVYSAISATVCDIMNDVIELIDEMDSNEPVEVRLNKRVSNAGRTFLTLTVL